MRRQTRCPDFRDKLGVRISATNSVSGDKPSGTGPAQLAGPTQRPSPHLAGKFRRSFLVQPCGIVEKHGVIAVLQAYAVADQHVRIVMTLGEEDARVLKESLREPWDAR